MGHRLETAAGPIDVWLPSGASLEDVDGVAYWSPDPRLGRFVVTPAAGEDGEALLATERAGGELDVEADERTERGGQPVHRLRYRVRHRVPREVVLTPAGRRHEGGEEVEHLGEVLLIGAGPQTVRAGYSVRADAPDELRARFAEVLDRLRVGSEA
jgi:hypothetical protein